MIASDTLAFFCVACGKEFLLKKSGLVEEPDSAISQVDDFQNIVSLYRHQFVHLQNGNTPPQIVVRLDGDAVQALSHSKPSVQVSSLYTPAFHPCLLDRDFR